MQTFLASEDITLIVPFRRDGEPFVADTGTTTYEVRGQDGTLLDSGSVTVGPADVAAAVEVPAASNAISTRFEKRTVIVRGLTGGRPFQARGQYRLTPWMNMSATNDDVRAFIGVGAGELPDTVIDLVDAFLQLEERTTQATLEAALASGTSLEIKANDGIVAQAVLNLIPSLHQRISLKESDGPASAQREKIDIAGLRRRASDVLSEAVTAVSGRTVAEQTLVAFAPTTTLFEA